MEHLEHTDPANTLPAIVVDRLARIETKLDSWADDRRRTEDRLSRLERFMWLAIGLSLASAAPNVIRAASVVAS